jgi:hypothetical protein
MANATSVLVEQRVVAFALGHPGFGPARIAVELGLTRFDGRPTSGVRPWEDVRHGEHGTQQASAAPVVHA